MRQGVKWMKEGFAEFMRRNTLQLAFMDRHEMLEKDLARITYSNGTKIYVNYCGKQKTVDGITIPPLDYSVVCR